LPKYNINSMIEFELIDKENIPDYHCVTYEVLESKEAILERNTELQKAMLLGNSEHVKYKIYFTTTDGVKEVETTVWAATDTDVTLKGGIIIPITAINKIAFL
jgi:hypothetical protein